MNDAAISTHGSAVRSAVALFAFLAAAAHGLLLENDQLRLNIDPETGRIVSLASADEATDIVDPNVDAPLWEIALSHEEQRVLLPADAGRFHVEPDLPAGIPLRMTWDDFDLDAAPDLRVVVETRLDAHTPVSYWTIALEGLGKLRAGAVRFPRIGAIAKQDGETLAVPVWIGESTTKHRQLLNMGNGDGRLEWLYPGLMSMQCIALYGVNGSGFYAACDDTEAYSKRFALFGNGEDGIGFEVVQLPENENMARGLYRSPYRVLLGTLQGDWLTAAERYRAWALRQSWARNSRLMRGTTPHWAVDCGLWVWNRGTSDKVLEPAMALQEVAGVPVSVFWHWWHGCAYDVGFPEYLPPREGAAPFRAAMQAAHEKDLHAIVYMNQRLWGMDTPSWEEHDAARYAVKGPDGRIQPEVYNTFTKSPCASMCMGTSFWRNYYAGIAAEAVLDLCVDGIYMDQACSSLACYDPAHGHPVGGGTYWIRGFQELQHDIRERCRGARRPIALAGEGCGEAWLPYLDLMLSLQVSMERYAAPGAWRPIPFFHAVYHGYFLPYGNYASLTMPPYDALWPKETAPAKPLALLDRKFSQQFRMEQARAFVWGQTPTLANFRPEHLDSRSAEIDFVIRLAKLRQRAAEFLLHGTMLRTPRMVTPDSAMPISRLSIYAGQQGALSEYEASYPLVLASTWESPEGGVGVVLANIADTAQRVAFTLDSANWPIPLEGVDRILDDDGSTRSVRYAKGTIAVEEAIPPMSARIHTCR